MDTGKKDRDWSEQQRAIFGWFAGSNRNLVVRARAGTGKTTTIIEGISHVPSGSILLAAFNKKIADELRSRLENPRAEAKTLHSIGFGFVRRNWTGMRLDDSRGERLARQAMGSHAPDQMVSLVARLAAKGKNIRPFAQAGDLVELAYQFDLVPDEQWEDDGWTVEEVELHALHAMTLALGRDGTVDFDDMIYVPIRNRWVRGIYDLVVVDEAQDMNFSQIEMARGVCRHGGRVVVVGDDRQAIYGFRGADGGSIDRLKEELRAIELGLTTTYRCPKEVVKLAQTLVPDYRAADTAINGVVSIEPFERLVELAEPGSFVLSRKNAPLAKVCLRLLRHGKRAKIEGRDIGQGLLSIVRKLKARTVVDFMEKLTKWEERTVARLQATGKKSAEARVETVLDQAETLRALAEGMAGVRELETRIADLFAETGGGRSGLVLCSSVHRAKGLEARTVFVLQDTLRWDSLEEQNIYYVAVTRSQERLVWVTGVA